MAITSRPISDPFSSPITICPDSRQPTRISPNETAISPDEQIDGLFFGEAANDLYGLPVALSDGGMTLAVGAQG